MSIKIFNNTNINEVLAYVYLYIGYLAIFFFFAYYEVGASKPIGLFLVMIATMNFFMIYILINHFLISFIIPHKTLIVFEILLIITLFVLFICYVSLWARYDYLHQHPLTKMNFTDFLTITRRVV